MSIQRALRGTAVFGGLAALLIGVVALPASASPLDRGTYHDVNSFSSSDDPEWPCDLGFDVTVTVDVHGSYLLNVRKPGTLAFGRESSQGTVTYSANGHTYSEEFAIADHDVSVTDNGDGTLTIIGQGAGSDKWFLDGELVFEDQGMTRVEVLIDDNDTPLNPFDDEFLSFVRVVKPSTGVNNGPTRSFCEDLADFLAPTP